MKQEGNQRGFSLVEILMVIGISSMITYAIFASMFTGDAQAKTADIKMAVQDSARESLYKVMQEIRSSSSNAVNGNIVTGANTIAFNIPNPASPFAGDFTENWNGSHRIQYSLIGNQLTRTNLTTGAVAVVGNDVTSVTFAQAAEVVTVTLNAQRQLINGRLVPATPLQLRARAELRNT